MRILVTAASKHEATAEIAARIGEVLEAAGHEVAVAAPELVDGVADYDAVVLGSAVYAGHWLPAAKAFAERHEDALRELPLWLFSSGPVGAPEPKPDGDPVDVAGLVEALRPWEHAVFAGRIDKPRLGYAERAIVRALRAPTGDFRDWEAIEAWARAVAAQLAPATTAA